MHKDTLHPAMLHRYRWMFVDMYKKTNQPVTVLEVDIPTGARHLSEETAKRMPGEIN